MMPFDAVKRQTFRGCPAAHARADGLRIQFVLVNYCAAMSNKIVSESWRKKQFYFFGLLSLKRNQTHTDKQQMQQQIQ